jgi:hypothetical protein
MILGDGNDGTYGDMVRINDPYQFPEYTYHKNMIGIITAIYYPSVYVKWLSCDNSNSRITNSVTPKSLELLSEEEALQYRMEL